MPDLQGRLSHGQRRHGLGMMTLLTCGTRGYYCTCIGVRRHGVDELRDAMCSEGP